MAQSIETGLGARYTCPPDTRCEPFPSLIAVSASPSMHEGQLLKMTTSEGIFLAPGAPSQRVYI